MGSTKQASKRKIGRPRSSGQEAEDNPLSTLSHDERRLLFLEAAASLFETKGYSETSISDITDRLGFTRGVFYYYWKNKREIVQEIHDRALAMMNERLDLVGEEESSAEARLEGAIRNHVEAVMRNRSVIAVLLGHFEFSEETLEGRRAYAERFQRLVEEGIAQGVVRDLDPKVLTFSILGLCNSVAQWYRPDGALPEAEIENILSTFARGGWRAE